MRHATPLLHRAGKSGITLSFGLVTMLLLMALLQGAATPIQDDQDDAQQLANDLVEVLLEAQEQGSGKEEEFDETEIFFEENATDGDLGIQFFLDGEGWRRVKIFYPDGRKMIDIKVKGNAGMIGLTEIFSESAEPSFDELPRDEFIALFPEGEYRMVGRSVEGARLVGVATLTHDMPDQPEITSPEEEEEVDAEDEFVIEWETVADPNWPDSIIEAYQIIVEKDEEEERLRVWTVDMLPTDTSVTLPAGFLEPGKAYKVEVIAVETSTNKTISEVEFETEDDD